MIRMYLSATLGSVLLQGGGRSAEEWLQLGTLVLSRSAEAIAAVVIAAGVLRALLRYVAAHLPGRGGLDETERIRLGLGRSLGLALEFLLAADVLATAVAPSWDAIGKLAAIATIRTLLNYFLGQELREESRQAASERRGGQMHGGTDGRGASPEPRPVAPFAGSARPHRAQDE